MTYDAGSRMTQEQFGTTTPIFNKLFYNSRGQLAEIREGLTGNNTNWERGAIINFYSSCWGMCAGQSMPNNNGNLLRQEHWIQNESGQVIGIPTQEFEYDSLNRVQWVKEGTNWRQQYSYDRYGNRLIDQANTFGDGIPKPDFGLDPSTNRLTAPAGYTMGYDAVGNLTNDTYSGQGQRTYDAENRMKQAWANGQWQTLALVGTGMLGVPVLAGSAAYAVAEAMHWRGSLEDRPRRAPKFYAVLAVAVLLGLILNYLKLNAVRMLFWAAVLNGMLAPPLIILVTLLSSDRTVMGKRVNPLVLTVLGWLTATVMLAATVMMFVTWRM